MATVAKSERSGALTPSQSQIVRELAERHGSRNIRVFGSRGRGEADPSSDLDLLVDMKKGSSLLDLIALKNDIEDALGIEVDLVTEAGLSRHLKDQVLREAVPL
ncbi:MAG: nucleotidyltransferase family protein [Solirubrobacterales bacterium]|nr:nucleotidyltransferase family protein [Solirubrobacterales bacterium]